MSINDFVKMNIFLCVICFSICAKIQGFIDECVFFYAEIQDGRQKWHENDFWENLPGESADTLWVKYFIEIALSHTVSKINLFLHFTQQFKMAAKNGGKVIFAQSRQ